MDLARLVHYATLVVEGERGTKEIGEVEEFGEEINEI